MSKKLYICNIQTSEGTTHLDCSKKKHTTLRILLIIIWKNLKQILRTHFRTVCFFCSHILNVLCVKRQFSCFVYMYFCKVFSFITSAAQNSLIRLSVCTFVLNKLIAIFIRMLLLCITTSIVSCYRLKVV